MLQAPPLFRRSRPAACPLARFAAALASATLMLCVAAAPALADDAQDADHQLHTLTAPSSPRFKITDRVWPKEVGEAHLCLWQDDKLAAISFSIDDNTKPDHDWWMQQSDTFGWKFTWFIITARVGGKSAAYYGTWADFVALLEKGHDVQSHSVAHFDVALGYTTIDQEYAPSIQAIEENLPGHKVTTLAYPNGLNANNDNDAALAGEVFIAVRGVSGIINAANTINYNNTNSIGAQVINTAEWTQLSDIITPKSKNYRGWYVSHAHGLNKPEYKQTIVEAMTYIKEHEDDLWVGLFREVALYGMQRDTATLTTLDNGDGSFTLSLTDQMDDTLFQHPLTIKLRVPDGWDNAAVIQGDRADAATIVQHDGKTFALVPVVPDAGDATITAGDATVTTGDGTVTQQSTPLEPE